MEYFALLHGMDSQGGARQVADRQAGRWQGAGRLRRSLGTLELFDLFVWATDNNEESKPGTKLHSWLNIVPVPAMSTDRPSATQIESLCFLLFNLMGETEWVGVFMQVWLQPESIIIDSPDSFLLTSVPVAQSSFLSIFFTLICMIERYFSFVWKQKTIKIC